jgi:hypothetical protein
MRQNATPFYVRGRSAESASQAKSAKLSDTNAQGNQRNDRTGRDDVVRITDLAQSSATLFSAGLDVPCSVSFVLSPLLKSV